MLQKLSQGTAHKLPKDLQDALLSSSKALATWEDITPLARNEWICWVISVKTTGTRKQHVVRSIEDLSKGKRRPCCWIGCIHRTDKPMNSTQKFILGDKPKKKV